MSNVEDQIIALAASAAQLAYDDGEGVIPEDASEVVEGASFIIDVVIPTGIESGDGRKLLGGSLSTRELPIPLLWQPKTGSGHDGSFIIGRIDTCDVTDEGIKNAKGVFDTGPYGREAERLVRNGMLRGISADLDKFETLSDEEMSEMAAETGEDLSQKLFIKKARTMAATLLPKPAFQECTIRIVENDQEYPIVDGIYEADTDLDDVAETYTSALIASAVPIEPPKDWFNDPRLKRETPLTINEDGQVYGHIATWVTDHIGQHGIKPPRSKSNYAYFHTGLVRTADKTDVAVGQLTLAGGHAALDKSAHEAVAHYDNTSSAIADVHAGEDAYGIWVAGALRPGVTPEQVRVMRASSPSGDWRPINGKLELVAVLHVNVPGFPIQRACVASGSVTALVAAGTSQLYRLKHPREEFAEQTSEISTRLASLESAILSEKRELAVKRMEEDRAARKAALVASANALREKFAPELSARAQQKADLDAAAEELRNRVMALRVPVKYDEKDHPRHRDGKWRKVLGRLSDLLDADDSGAKDAIKRAADSEEVGDDDEARAAGREAKVSLEEAQKREVDPKRKGVIAKAIEEIDNVDKDDVDGPERKKAPGEDLLEAGISAAVEKIIDELIGENLDPKAIADRAFNSLKHYVDDKKISVQDLTKLIAEKIQKKFTPGIVQ